MKHVLLSLFAALVPAMINLQAAEPVKTESESQPKPAAATNKVIVGAGCFWCVEAIFQRANGVKKVISGYSGGHVPNPTYEQICAHNTGHAEVAEIEFDPAVTSLDKVLDVFFVAHDPTTLNRQGADVGDQYRSVIFYANEEQKKTAEAAKQRAKSEWKDPIVTEISPLKKFYPAEDYHQNYFNLNKNRNPYCSAVIGPKLHKLVQKGIIKE